MDKGNAKKIVAGALLLFGMATAWASSQTPLTSNVQTVGQRAAGGHASIMNWPPPVGNSEPTPTPQ